MFRLSLWVKVGCTALPGIHMLGYEICQVLPDILSTVKKRRLGTVHLVSESGDLAYTSSAMQSGKSWTCWYGMASCMQYPAYNKPGREKRGPGESILFRSPDRLSVRHRYAEDPAQDLTWRYDRSPEHTRGPRRTAPSAHSAPPEEW